MQNLKLNEDNYIELKKFACDWGADLFGVADISGIKDKFVFSGRALEEIHKAVSLGVRLSKSVLEEIEKHPTKLYFHHYRTVNMFLDQLAIRLTNFIQAKGSLALPVPASQILDWEKQTGHLAHKEIAFLAGLGWIGRNNLLVNRNYGSHIRLATVLTDMPLKIDHPLKDECGDCRACIAVCPVGAIKEKAEEIDHERCFERLKGFKREGFAPQYICGICVKACSGKPLT